LLLRKSYDARGATYSPNGKQLALIPQGGTYIDLLDIATKQINRIAID